MVADKAIRQFLDPHLIRRQDLEQQNRLSWVPVGLHTVQRCQTTWLPCRSMIYGGRCRPSAGDL